jgi:S-adenosylmethionine-dependent methyltransferase
MFSSASAGVTLHPTMPLPSKRRAHLPQSAGTVAVRRDWDCGMMGCMASFESGERLWVERLGNLRNVVRQELIARQLADHVVPGMSVLDVGCGQGTQGVRLAQGGCVVTGVDPSAELLDRFSTSADLAEVAVELLHGTLDDLDSLLGSRRFDLVCAHGVLMYIGNRTAAVAQLADRVSGPDGRLSITVRNGHALAMRPGLRGDWNAAIAAFDAEGYINEVGVEARADRLEDVSADLKHVGMEIVSWSGVRVFNDAVSADAAPPRGIELEKLLDAEDLAGRRDPYRWMASQLHVVAAHTPT